MPDRELTAPLITSRSNARVKALRASLSGKAAKAGDLLGIEGERLLHEAQLSELELESVFVREGSEPLLHAYIKGGRRAKEHLRLSREVFDSAVNTEAPQGIVATWRILERATPRPADLTLLLEEVQDPGNVGTLVRSAEAFGAAQVWLTPGSANAWNPKAVRASAGSMFRMPVRRGTLKDLGQAIRAGGTRLFAAVAAADSAVVPREADFLGPCVILIGSEGKGLSEQALSLADRLVRIPCDVESLNAAVAGSILLYEAKRQRSQP